MRTALVAALALLVPAAAAEARPAWLQSARILVHADLQNQDCRDIAYYLGTLPRAAGDHQGPLIAAWQQLMMTLMPPLTRYAESLVGNPPPHGAD